MKCSTGGGGGSGSEGPQGTETNVIVKSVLIVCGAAQ